MIYNQKTTVQGGSAGLRWKCGYSLAQYSCGVVLVFWFWQEIVLGITYILSVQYTCAVVGCVRFLVVAGDSVVAGNSSQNENTF